MIVDDDIYAETPSWRDKNVRTFYDYLYDCKENFGLYAQLASLMAPVK